MEISSRQIVALGAPLIVTYLTWSALSSRVTTLVQMKKNLSVATGAVSKRPHIDQLARNPFAPIGAADEDVPSDFDGAADSGDAATLHLDGTAVRGNWR